jgi:two-component system nitrogen regulation response regulator GlnG
MHTRSLPKLIDPEVRSIRRTRVRLIVEGDASAIRASPYERALIRIGADPANDLVIPDEFVSAHHAELELIDDGFALRDLHSTNGTWLGEHRIREAFVTPGTVFIVGRTAVRIEADGSYEVALAPPRTSDIVAQTTVMRECVAQLERYAQSDQPVLLEGETGVGKDLFARILHKQSSRRNGPFEVFDSGAVSPSLIEAEIFGHARGAYTDAKDARPGVFERAHGGTLFLDEVGELPLELQPKLLRVLESQKVRRLGGSRDIPANVRVVAATNRDLATMVDKKAFRADLFYRLNVLRLEIPPLRRRREDIPLLAAAILSQAGSPLPPRGLDPAALAMLVSYDWPGNVRELKNVLHRAAVLASGSIEPEDLILGGEDTVPSAAIDLGLPYHEAKERCVEAFERTYIQKLLERHDRNVSRAAESAGIPRQTLHRLMSKHSIRKQ